jgi:hypothetical protein
LLIGGILPQFCPFSIFISAPFGVRTPGQTVNSGGEAVGRAPIPPGENAKGALLRLALTIEALTIEKEKIR